MPMLLSGTGNTAIIAETGAGKTMAYAIAAVNHVDSSKPRVPQVICLCATHESAIETSALFYQLAQFTKVTIGMAVKDPNSELLLASFCFSLLILSILI